MAKYLCFYLVLLFKHVCWLTPRPLPPSDPDVQTGDLASANASEEDKVKAMMNQSSKDYDPSRYVNTTVKKHCVN